MSSPPVMRPHKIKHDDIKIMLPRKWITNKKTEAYTSQISMPYVQSPWLVIEGAWGQHGDILLESPDNKKNDFRNQSHIVKLRDCLEEWTSHISKQFRDQLYRDERIFMGDDTKTYGLMKHNYTSLSKFMRLKKSRSCECVSTEPKANHVTAIRVIFSISAIHLIDDKLSFSSQAHLIEYEASGANGSDDEDDDDDGTVVFDAANMWD